MPESLRGKAWTAALAAVLGATGAIFVSGYWLIDLLPAESKQLVLLSVLVAVAAAVLYFILISWMWRGVRQLGSGAKGIVVVASLLLSIFLFFAATQQWRNPGRYVGFLLPRHELRLSAAPTVSAASVRLTWFNTSLGDVSFDALGATGWARQGDGLVLTASSDNVLSWRGVTGDRVQIVVVAGNAGDKAVLGWDGQEEQISLERGRNTFDRTFTVPYYASRSLIVLLGLINAFVLSAALVLIMWQRRGVWQAALQESVVRPGCGLDRWDAAALLASIGLALALRAFNLGSVFPAVDEYYHLIAAQQLLHGADLGSVYQRGLWIVTLPIALALRVFGHQVWAARLVGVLFNTLAIVPLYLITRKVNRPVAFLSGLLYACSPWIITFARVAREYAFYPFYFYWIVYAMVLFAAAIPKGAVFIRDWREILKPKLLLLGALLCLPPFFGLTVDWLSTFRTILIAYVVLGLIVLMRFDWADRRNWPVLALFFVGVAFGARSWYLEQSSKLLTWPRLNEVPLEYFFPNPQQQWYFDRAVVIIALAVVAAVIYAYAVHRLTFIPGLLTLLLFTYLIVFAFFSKSFFHTRHLLTTELWYVGVSAAGLYTLWMVVLAVVPLRRNLPRIALALVLGVATVNAAQILVPSLSANPDMPISEDYLHDMSNVQAFMVGHVQPSDVLISTVYGLYASWEQAPGFRTQYRITSATPEEDILRIVESNPSGWIVIDKIRLDLSTLSPKDFSRLGQIEYVGTFGDEYVWRWQRSSG